MAGRMCPIERSPEDHDASNHVLDATPSAGRDADAHAVPKLKGSRHDDRMNGSDRSEMSPAESDQASSGRRVDSARGGDTHEDTPSSLRRANDRARRYMVASIVLFLLLGTAVTASTLSRRPEDPGATLIQADGQNLEALKARLAQEAREGMMSISVSAQPILDDGSLAVNVINKAQNRMHQVFSVEQDGELLYSSGVIAPGEQVASCPVGGAARPGDALITITPTDEDGTARGNATAINVRISSPS